VSQPISETAIEGYLEAEVPSKPRDGRTHRADAEPTVRAGRPAADTYRIDLRFDREEIPVASRVPAVPQPVSQTAIDGFLAAEVPSTPRDGRTHRADAEPTVRAGRPRQTPMYRPAL